MKKLVIANWKMNPETSEQAVGLFDSINQGVGDLQNTEIVICPPFVWLPILLKKAPSYAKGYGGFAFGSQNCFWEQQGAFTGEISPKMLKNLGCEYVILGHSETRMHLGETDEIIGKKLTAALDANLIPILCIGDKDIQVQLQKAMLELKESDLEKMIIAYEPIWAISSQNGIAVPLNQAKQSLIFLKKYFENNFEIMPKILYGGSVDSNNAKDYIDIGFDGLLVGNASLNPKEFIKIIDKLEKI